MSSNVLPDPGALELSETLLALHAARALDAVIEVVLDWGRAHCANAKCFGVLVCADDTLRWCGGWAQRTPSTEQTFELPQALRQARASSADRRADFSQPMLADCDVFQSFSSAGVLLAVVVVDEANLSTAHAEALDVLSEHLGVGVERATESAALQERQASSDRLLTALRWSQEFAAAISVRALMHRVLERACHVTGAQKGSLMLYDHHEAMLRVRMVHGLPDALVEAKINAGELPTRSFQPGEGIAGKVFQTGRPLMVAHTQRDPRFVGDGEHVGVILCYPLKDEGETIGVVNLTHRSSDGVLRYEEERLAVLMQMAAVALRRAEVLDQVTLDARTGLPGKALFCARLKALVEVAERTGGTLTLLCADGVEDDDALAAMGQWLRRVLRRNSDLATYVGSGRFVVLLEGDDAAGVEGLRRRFEVAAESSWTDWVTVARAEGESSEEWLTRALAATRR